MNEKNKFKILLTDNSFDITLNPGESMDLHVKNQDGKVYLSSIPTQSNGSNASLSTNDIYINNGYKSVNYSSSNELDNLNNISRETNKVQSSIYDLLSKKNHSEDVIEEENLKHSQQDYIESDSINEVETIKQTEDEEVQEDTEKPIEEEQPSQTDEGEPEKNDSNIEVLKRKYFPIDEDEDEE